MKKNMWTKKEVIDFVLDDLQKKNFDPGQTANNFIDASGINSDSDDAKEWLEDMTRQISPDDFFSLELPFKKKIVLIDNFSKFIVALTAVLGYELPLYADIISVTLEKNSAPSLEVFNYTGNNKMNVKRSELSAGLLYR